MAENVHDFTRNYTTPHNVFPRSEEAPTSSEVGQYWPLSYAQESAKAPFEAEPLVLKSYADPFPRAAQPPTSAEVKNWPYPQYAQQNV